ncbi:hypothetical protein FA95DRAFT_1286163 [Auriscalpium vulgare]|uniref:Uncharacterized protein n=1 Tax=Auriscalpium vulgare TaxID=40419 RepID=A0ACB8R3L1_9AGAM|nr:hypothetical protein FA95DRAFT_1286163 [Auriscalpium vulgare]
MIIERNKKKSIKEQAIERHAQLTDAQRKAQKQNDKVHDMRRIAKQTETIYNRLRNLWTAFTELEYPNNADVPAEIKLGVQLPSEEVIKHFIKWYSVTCVGKIEKTISLNTVKSYASTFCALWPRYAGVTVPEDVRKQIVEFIHSDRLSEASGEIPITMRIKRYAGQADLDRLLRVYWEDQSHIRTNRMRVEMLFTSILSAISSERPGAIMEASGYRHSNEAINWGDVDFVIVPNPADPPHPTVVALVRIRLMKGYRLNKAVVKSFFLSFEPNASRAADPLVLLFYMALQDGIFENVKTIEEILEPVHQPADTHTLTIREAWRKVPILRKEVYAATAGWEVSDTLALPYQVYAAFLHWASDVAGFSEYVRPYDFRRGASNSFSQLLTEEQRTSLTGHTPKSMVFWAKYHSNTSKVDLQGLFRGEQDVEKVAVFHELENISRGADPKAPTSLTLAQRQDLLMTPELCAMREERDKLIDEAQAIIDKSRDDDPNVMLQVAPLYEKAKSILADYSAIVLCGTKQAILAARQEYFAQASARRLDGVTAPSTSAMATARPAAPVLPTDPHAQLLSSLYDESTVPIPEHVMAALAALQALPLRPHVACYPNEAPDADGNCPVCLVPCIATKLNRSSGGIAAHIHACVQRREQEQALTVLASQYKPRTCAWVSCPQRSTVWDTRECFNEHVQKHVQALRAKPRPGGTHLSCKWALPGGAQCGENDCDHWLTHFAEVHALNVRDKVVVNYCFMCGLRFTDYIGDGAAWLEHCETHFESEFVEPYLDAKPIKDPIGIVVYGAPTNAIEYAHGSGFDGKQPEYHGDIRSGLVLAPPLCAFCVHNESLAMDVRMKQWDAYDTFGRHVVTQHAERIDHDQPCPVPSCGSHIFTPHELLDHMIRHHRMPMCGSTKHVGARRLRLPPAPDAETKKQPDKKRKRMQENMVRGRCCGCNQTRNDVESHITNADPEGRCRKVGAYWVVVGDEKVDSRTAPRIKWTPPDDELSLSSTTKGDRKHLCRGCGLQFRDIRDHLKEGEPCNGKTIFRIRDTINFKAKDFGPEADFFDWIASAPPYIPMGAPRHHMCVSCHVRYVDFGDHIVASAVPACKSAKFKIKINGEWSEAKDYAQWAESGMQ